VTVTAAAREILENSAKGSESLPVPGASQRWIEFTVSDTGVGIPADRVGRIFDKFYQVDSTETRRFGGVGMGLYIAKRFTELLGGHITVESTEGKGTKFTLTVPCEPRPGPHQELPVESPRTA
jgi:signal transduction histidine kinase